MTTPMHSFGEGGERTHAAMMSALTPDTPSVLDRHESMLADHDARLDALENPPQHTDMEPDNGDELA